MFFESLTSRKTCLQLWSNTKLKMGKNSNYFLFLCSGSQAKIESHIELVSATCAGWLAS